eukprot:scaffold63326_cov72-Cyclotella_meneghiniana.AAC.3
MNSHPQSEWGNQNGGQQNGNGYPQTNQQQFMGNNLTVNQQWDGGMTNNNFNWNINIQNQPGGMGHQQQQQTNGGQDQFNRMNLQHQMQNQTFSGGPSMPNNAPVSLNPNQQTAHAQATLLWNAIRASQGQIGNQGGQNPSMASSSIHQGTIAHSQMNQAAQQAQSFPIALNNNQGGENSSGFNAVNQVQAPIHLNQMQQPTQMWSSQTMQQQSQMPQSNISMTNFNQSHNSTLPPSDQTGNGVYHITGSQQGTLEALAAANSNQQLLLRQFLLQQNMGLDQGNRRGIHTTQPQATNHMQQSDQNTANIINNGSNDTKSQLTNPAAASTHPIRDAASGSSEQQLDQALPRPLNPVSSVASGWQTSEVCRR